MTGSTGSTRSTHLGTPGAARPPRLGSLDLFRGITIAGMILVNTHGNPSTTYRALEHHPWDGLTPADWVQPWFLFIIGVSMVFSFAARRARGEDDRGVLAHTFRRTLILFALGLLYNWFPFIGFDAATFRIPGIAQRIALCYLMATVIVVYFGPRGQAIAAVALLVGYQILMMLVPVPGLGLSPLTEANANRNMAAWLDRLLMGQHLGYGNHDWDANGFLASFPATVNTLLGVAVGRELLAHVSDHGRVLRRLAVAGVILTVAGWLWGGCPPVENGIFLGAPRFDAPWVFAINKHIWTSSFVIITSGLGCLGLAACFFIVEVKHWTRISAPMVVLGTNAILAFMLSGLVGHTLGRVRAPFHGKAQPLSQILYDGVFAPLTSNGYVASLLFSMLFLAIWIATMAVFHRKRIFLKV